MKKLSEVLTPVPFEKIGKNESFDLLQRPEITLITTPISKLTDEQKQSTKWLPGFGEYDEYIELAGRLGTYPTAIQQYLAFNVRLEKARIFLLAIEDHTCPDCQKVTIHKDGCGCKDDESPE